VTLLPVLRSRIAALVAVAAAGALALTLVPGAAASAAASAVPALSAPPAAVAAVPADVDDFTFASFDAVYDLGRDPDGRSVLETTETLVAQFPEVDQNRGIRRAIPLEYDGHPVEVRVESVTDAAGRPRPYETETDDEDEFLLVTIAGSGYVHGEQTYVITYSERNVTQQPDDADVDEFYRDVNGTGWAQPFQRVRAELRVDEALAEAFTGDAACYRGGEGSRTPCESLESGGTPLLVAVAVGLGAHENLTIAAAFQPGTFVPRDESFWSSPAAMLSGAAAIVAFAMFVLALGLRLTRWRPARGGTIIAQYEPAAGVSTLLAADLVDQPARGVTATILERAVAGEVRILDRGAEAYSVQFTGGPLGDADAQSVVRALFGDHPAVGQERPLGEKSTSLGQRLIAIRRAVAERSVAEGLRRSPARGPRVAIALVALLAAIPGFLGAVIALEADMGGFWPVVTLIAAVVFAIGAAIATIGVRPLTVEGRRMRDHLDGLRLFIGLAEADRIRMLQSPAGALRDPIGAAGGVAGTVGAAEMLRLTERLLPFAALFGLEKEWLRELASLYEVNDERPGWYAGSAGFDAAVFSAAVSSFASASSTAWSGSAASSSSSGSSGGGSSGGGGGGGGGGGV
jgi:uncharacterized membrane protein YgcG